MKLSIKAHGFTEGAAFFKEASRRVKTVVPQKLKAFGGEAVARLKESIKHGELNLAPKARSDGNPVLIHTGVYVESFVAEVKGAELTIGNEGMNADMSNEDLGELLEYGTNTMPARPHIRPLNLWVEKKLPELGERIARGLLGSR